MMRMNRAKYRFHLIIVGIMNIGRIAETMESIESLNKERA